MALRIMPSVQSAVNLLNAGRFAEAWAACHQILDVDPREVMAMQVGGLSLLRLGRLADAKLLLDKAIAAQPNNISFLLNYGVVAAELGHWERVDELCRKVAALDPTNVVNLNLQGCSARNQMKMEEAAGYFRQSIKVKPDFEEGMTNLGTTLWMMGELEQAKEVLGRCMKIHARRGAAELAYGAILLEQGEWAKGWEMYQSRWTSREAKPRRHTNKPQWTGQDLTGKRILIYGEQGLGDSLQFVRYAALLKERGAWVSVECEHAVKSLLTRCPGVDEVHGFGEAAPPFDYAAAMLDLPGPLGTTLENVPADVPYLSALPERVEKWKQRLKNDPPGLRVGLVWSGNPANSRDNLRSVPMAEMAAWGGVPGVTWYSLQLQHGRNQPRPPGWKMIDLADDMTSFEETAAIAMALDLVVTVDTAMAHVSGALGRPVWVLLPRWGDWRWMQGTTDTPWYPSMRLFRQTKLTHWDKPIADVAVALTELAAGR